MKKVLTWWERGEKAGDEQVLRLRSRLRGGGTEAHLAFTLLRPGWKPHITLKKLLERVTKVKKVAADFCTVRCIKLLEEKRIRYLVGRGGGKKMPTMLRDLEPKLIRKGKAEWLRLHVMKSRKESVKLFAARTMDEGELHVFAVSTSESKGQEAYTRSSYGTLYEGRFGIDTSYGMMRKVWGWTTSNSPSLRLFLFSPSVSLYNIWVLTKLLSDNHNEDKEEEERIGVLTWTIRLGLELSPMLKEVIGHSSIY